MNKELQELFSEAGCMISQLGIYNGNDNEYQARKALRSIEAYISEFFSQNVCIPKGENRHPYADVLHVWIEDTSKELQANYKDGKFVDYVIHYQDYKYRIKPSEPVYEWQCYTVSMSGAELIGWFIDNEIGITKPQMYKLEETKRVRQ